MRSSSGTLVNALVYHWFAFLAVAAGVTLGVALVVQAQPSRYDSSAVVAFAPRPESDAGVDVVRVLAPQFVAVATAPSTLDAAAAEAGVSRDEWEDGVDATLLPDTNTIELTVGYTDPGRAAALASALASQVVEATRDDPLLTASVVSAAAVPTVPAAPARGLYGAAGLLAGLLLGVGAAVALERLYPRIRGVEGLQQATGVPVLARVQGDLRPEPAALDDPGVGPPVRGLRLLLDDEVQAAEPREDGPAPHVVALVGAGPGQGTSDLASALTHAFAALGRDVLLVTADASALVSGSGLVRAMRGIPLAEMVEPLETRGPGTASRLQPATTAGNRSGAGDPLADLVARAWPALLASAAASADLVVVDGPPTGPGSLAPLMARGLPTVLVVRAGTDRPVVSEASTALQASGSRLVGTVLVGGERRLGRLRRGS